jgi:hypothetical protein
MNDNRTTAEDIKTILDCLIKKTSEDKIIWERTKKSQYSCNINGYRISVYERTMPLDFRTKELYYYISINYKEYDCNQYAKIFNSLIDEICSYLGRKNLKDREGLLKALDNI